MGILGFIGVTVITVIGAFAFFFLAIVIFDILLAIIHDPNFFDI